MDSFKKRKNIKLKRLISIIILFVFISVWIFVFINRRKNTLQEIKISFLDSFPVYSSDEILSLIKKEADINYKISDLNLQAIENKINGNLWIKNSEVFIMNNKLNIKIQYKKPVFKVITNKNEIFYIDENAILLPIPTNVIISVPLAINFDNTKRDSVYYNTNKKLTDAGKIILSDSNYSSQYFYFNLKNINRVEMIIYNPKIKFILGNLDNFKSKIHKAFYFHLYAKSNNFDFSEIDVQYHNQIIGIKK